MKTTKIITILVVALGLILCQARISEAAEMGTAFTYQGHLYDSNHIAEGLYDFQFKLYDANSDGNQIGVDVNTADVDVLNGYFMVGLDFNEPNAFNGDARWLEIGVRPGELEDSNAYTALSPRQEITPTPYALGVKVPLTLKGDVHIEGQITKEFAEGTSNLATPIAYGHVLGDGSLASGTPNVSSEMSAGNYEITISGENYVTEYYVTVVSLSSATATDSAGVAQVFGSQGKLIVSIYDISGTPTTATFQFVTYKP